VTNLQKESKEGSVVLDVLSTRDFQVGEEIVIGKGTTSEEYNHIIVAFGWIELRTPLQNTHASGTSVQIKATCAVFAKYYACETYHPYMEQIDCQHNLKPSDYGMNALSCAPEDAVHCCASTTTKKPPTTTTKVATTKKVEIAPGARLFNAKEVVQGQASASTFGSAGMLALWLFIGVAGLTAGARAMKRSAQRTIQTESMTSFLAVATDDVEEQQEMEEQQKEMDMEEYGLYEAPPKETIRMSSFMALPTEEEVGYEEVDI